MAGDLTPYQGDLEPDEEYDSLEFDGASFDGAHAGNCHFLDCSFVGTTFDGSRLRKARFTDTRLRDTRFVACDLAETGWQDVTLAGCALAGVQAFSASMRRVTFRDCKLDSVNFRSATLTDVRFEDCLLRDAEFGGARLLRVSFGGCTLARADFTRVSCTEVDLRGAALGITAGYESLRGATIDSVQLIALAPLLARHLGITVTDALLPERPGVHACAGPRRRGPLIRIRWQLMTGGSVPAFSLLRLRRQEQPERRKQCVNVGFVFPIVDDLDPAACALDIDSASSAGSDGDALTPRAHARSCLGLNLPSFRVRFGDAKPALRYRLHAGLKDLFPACRESHAALVTCGHVSSIYANSGVVAGSAGKILSRSCLVRRGHVSGSVRFAGPARCDNEPASGGYGPFPCGSGARRMGPVMMMLPVVRAARGDELPGGEAPEVRGAQRAPWCALSRDIGVDRGLGETVGAL